MVTLLTEWHVNGLVKLQLLFPILSRHFYTFETGSVH